MAPCDCSRVHSTALASRTCPYDAGRFVFAGKSTAEAPWDIYEMALDGESVRQITRDLGDCRQPSYQSSHYQISDSNDTWPQITFVRCDDRAAGEGGVTPVSQLWTCKPDGTLSRPITFNLANDAEPTILGDGRTAVCQRATSGSSVGSTRRRVFAAGRQYRRHRLRSLCGVSRQTSEAHAVQYAAVGCVCRIGRAVLGRFGVAGSRLAAAPVVLVPAAHERSRRAVPFPCAAARWQSAGVATACWTVVLSMRSICST